VNGGLFGFGFSDDIPVVGDWTNAGGRQNLGRFQGGNWFLDLNGNQIFEGCAIDACVTFGESGDIPVAGKWSGTGPASVGVFRRGLWLLDSNANRQFDGCGPDACPEFGAPDVRPVVGDWNASGTSKIGIFKDGFWVLDFNGSRAFEGCSPATGADACFGFGLPGDLPVVGDWAGTGNTRVGVVRGLRWFLDFNGNGQWDGCGVGQPDRCVDALRASNAPIARSFTVRNIRGTYQGFQTQNISGCQDPGFSRQVSTPFSLTIGAQNGDVFSGATRAEVVVENINFVETCAVLATFHGGAAFSGTVDCQLFLNGSLDSTSSGQVSGLLTDGVFTFGAHAFENGGTCFTAGGGTASLQR
jgi:hypothetical protein